MGKEHCPYCHGGKCVGLCKKDKKDKKSKKDKKKRKRKRKKKR